jgi:hypothetical protein
MVMPVVCPTCRGALGIRPEDQGKAMLCPHCRHPFLAPAPRPAPAVPAPPAPPRPTWRSWADFEFANSGGGVPASSPPVDRLPPLKPDPPPAPAPQPPPLVRGDFQIPDRVTESPASPEPERLPPPEQDLPRLEHSPPVFDLSSVLEADQPPAPAGSPAGESDYELVGEQETASPPPPVEPAALPEVLPAEPPGRLDPEDLEEVLPVGPTGHEYDGEGRSVSQGWKPRRRTKGPRPAARSDLSRRGPEAGVLTGATVSLGLGVLSCLTSCVPVLGFPLGLTGYYVATLAMNNLGYRDDNAHLIVWARLLSVLGITLSAIVFVLALLGLMLGGGA